MAAQVITIAQQKGGAGKTTLAVHLSIAFMQRGLRVAVIDIDPQGSLTHWHKIREERFGEDYTGLTFSSLSGWRVASEVSRLRRNHDIILIDSPPHVETEARTAIRSADMILIPVQPSPTDLWATQATVNLAKGEKIPMRIVLNRVNPNSKLAEIIAEELSDIAISALGNRVIYAAALMEGFGVTEVAPASPAAMEIKTLAKEVMKLIPKIKDEVVSRERETA